MVMSLRQKQMSVSCDDCSAKAGEPCRYESGKVQRGIHGSREMKAFGVTQ